MSELFIGRKVETEILLQAAQHRSSRFVAVFGRRRVGKTFLIRQVFKNTFAFQITGVVNITTEQQLFNFARSMQLASGQSMPVPENWFIAFNNLVDYLLTLSKGKKVLFFDELPWLDTPNSDFIPALEHFWNSWASAQTDILLITCGSSASWMINELIKNKGGLHNRVTDRIRLEPFNLAETETFFRAKNQNFDRYSIIQLYMVMGGIPFYLDYVSGKESAMQNIERICFSSAGFLREEFSFLLQSLFAKSDRHLAVLTALSSKTKGLTRKQIIEVTKLHNSGHLSTLLRELEESGFIQSYAPFGKKKREIVYRLSDFYTAFYFKFIKNATLFDENNWLNAMESGQYRAWSGYAFEQVCLHHIKSIKKALRIEGIVSHASAWQGHDGEMGAQIDLIIDRKDRVINVFELKFSEKSYTITKSYAAQLGEKINLFKSLTKTRKSVFLSMVTTFGLTKNAYASALVQHDFDMDIFFEE